MRKSWSSGAPTTVPTLPLKSEMPWVVNCPNHIQREIFLEKKEKKHMENNQMVDKKHVYASGKSF
jgi:hypothetical protein